jgi:DNA-binding transcriptional regulator of glucitol operon
VAGFAAGTNGERRNSRFLFRLMQMASIFLVAAVLLFASAAARLQSQSFADGLKQVCNTADLVSLQKIGNWAKDW